MVYHCYLSVKSIVISYNYFVSSVIIIENIIKINLHTHTHTHTHTHIHTHVHTGENPTNKVG